MHFSILEKLGLGVLVAMWVVWGAGQIGGLLVHAEEGNIEALRIATPEIDAAETTEVAAVEEDIMVMLASADSGDGAKVYKKCAACHTLESGGANRVGPNLWGVVGRVKAAAPGYSYSEALSGLGSDWTFENLNDFLKNPKEYAPGNKMSFRGLSKASDRAALIAYLREYSDSPLPLP